MLRLELVAEIIEATGAPMAPRVVTHDVAHALTTAGWLVGLARGTALREGRDTAPTREADALAPELVKVQYGSPLVLLMQLPEEVCRDVIALSVVVYGVKRLWGIPLEVRTHLEEQRARLFEAQERALLAEQKLLEARVNARAPLAKPPDRKLAAIDRDLLWDKGTMRGIEGRLPRNSKWKGDQATWLVDD